MNILYLHGLDSKLSPEKRAVLEKFGKVFAADLNYYKDPNAIDTVMRMYPEVEFHAVVGSSMGGFAGFHVSNALERPALLFNPALVKRSVTQKIPAIKTHSRLQQFVLGQVDDVISPADTLSFLAGRFNPVTNFYLHLVPGLDHNIPVAVFEEEVKSFFGKF